VAADPGVPTPDVVDGDARRGRRALVRRRSLRTGAGLVLVAAVGIGAASLPGGGEPRTRTVAPASEDVPNVGVDLVAFDGPLAGAALRPAEIPTGWSVGGDAHGLLVAPPGERPVMTGAFTGKIFVYLDKGVPGEPLSKAQTVPVGDRTGYVIPDDPSALQVYVPLDDHTVLRAQAPPSLHWDPATLGRFLGGVKVLAGAKASVG
jgi:hypothetical protein